MEVIVEKLVHGGKGVARHGGKTILIPFAAPGDRLRIELTADHGTWAEAKILQVIVSGSERIQPRCPVFGECGGCQWQHLSYDAQLKWKRNIIVESLTRIGGFEEKQVEALVEDPIPAPSPWYYRNRIQLHVDRHGSVGFYRSRSQEVVEFEECFIAERSLNEELKRLRSQLRARRKGVSLRTSRESASFGQVNTEQNERLKQLVTDWVRTLQPQRVLELYAGGGNFTFPIASVVESVVAVDIDHRAIEAASRHARRERIANIQFQAMSALQGVRSFQRECDLLFLDPPRKGAAEVIDEIARLKPRFILYISCDPATLARDIKRLHQHGWKLKRSLPVDMFPQTFHIETMNLLSRESVAFPRDG